MTATSEMAGEPADSRDRIAGRDPRSPSRGRLVVRIALTVVSVAAVWAALAMPAGLLQFSPDAFIRLPLAALGVAAIIAAMRTRPPRWLAMLAGLTVGALVLLKALDVGSGDRHQPSDVVTAQRHQREFPIDQGELVGVEVQLSQQRRRRGCLVRWQVLPGQPSPALDPEQVGCRAADHQVSMQDRLNLILQPGPLPHQVPPPLHLAAQGRAVWASGIHTAGR